MRKVPAFLANLLPQLENQSRSSLPSISYQEYFTKGTGLSKLSPSSHPPPSPVSIKGEKNHLRWAGCTAGVGQGHDIVVRVAASAMKRFVKRTLAILLYLLKQCSGSVSAGFGPP
jgi:hypothetical protein